MDRISLLSDDLILKILSLIPTKDSVSSSLLSKRWRYPWKHVPKLEYCDSSSDTEHWRASRFVDKFLLLHIAPVLETLRLRLGRNCPSTDIETWISIAISRGLRNLLLFQYRPCKSPIQFPKSLYTCATLVHLQLYGDIIVDVPWTIFFPSLKSLFLAAVNFSSDQTVHRLLSGCPVLQNLAVVRFGTDNVKTFTISVPSLQRLTIIDWKSASQVLEDDHRLVIKAPSLNSLTYVNYFNSFCSLVKLPKLVKANIKLRHGDCKKLLECLTSAKHLSLCVEPPMDSYPTCVFCHLVSLKLCTCSSDWCRLILKHTPKLQVLRFELPTGKGFGRCCSSYGVVQTQWEEPSSVPQCLISSLETVEWIGYKGTEAEKKVVIYLLENARQLKKMAIRSLTSIQLEEKHRMLLELASSQRSSTKCRLSFT